MSTMLIGREGADNLHPVQGWGDVPVADRPLWSRYMLDHMPWFPGVTATLRMAPGVMHGRTRAPKIWKDDAQALHATGFTPADYYLLAELITGHIEKLNAERHEHLFTQWPKSYSRNLRVFRLHAEAWMPWLEKVRAGESPRRALEWVLTDGNPEPLGELYPTNGGPPMIIR